MVKLKKIKKGEYETDRYYIVREDGLGFQTYGYGIRRIKMWVVRDKFSRAEIHRAHLLSEVREWIDRNDPTKRFYY